MEKLNKNATAIFIALLEQMKGKDSIKIDNNKPDSGLMAVHLEYLHRKLKLGSDLLGKVYSLAHYFIQNGDSMADPDVEFLVKDVRTAEDQSLDLVAIYPISFKQDSLGIYREDVVIDGEKIIGFKKHSQRENTRFCNMWLNNIKFQQGIKPAKNQPIKTGSPKIQNIYQKLNIAAKSLGFNSLTAAYQAGKQEDVIKAAKNI